MKKKDTKARMQIIFGALILALFFSVELYMMINYSDKYLIIAGIALVELIFLYVIIQGIFALKEEKEIRNEAQYDNVFKSEKASYLMLKKYFEEFEDKLNYLEKASKVPTEEIVNAQKGIAKVVMNRTRQGSEAMLNRLQISWQKCRSSRRHFSPCCQVARRRLSPHRNLREIQVKSLYRCKFRIWSFR